MEKTLIEDALKLSPKNVSLFERLCVFLATSAGAGFSPKAPGTAGSLVGLFIYYMWGQHWALWVQGVVGLFIFGVGIYSIHVIQKKAGQSDDQRIVIDEVAGQWISLLGITQVWIMVVGFVLFRILDIVKIYPANYFDENRKDGVGIMMDDVVSGIYARSVLALIMIGMKLL